MIWTSGLEGQDKQKWGNSFGKSVCTAAEVHASLSSVYSFCTAAHVICSVKGCGRKVMWRTCLWLGSTWKRGLQEACKRPRSLTRWSSSAAMKCLNRNVKSSWVVHTAPCAASCSFPKGSPARTLSYSHRSAKTDCQHSCWNMADYNWAQLRQGVTFRLSHAAVSFEIPLVRDDDCTNCMTGQAYMQQRSTDIADLWDYGGGRAGGAHYHIIFLWTIWHSSS